MKFNFIHYGNKHFDKFYQYDEPLTNHPFYDKPVFCLYGSPINSKHNWKEWSKENIIKGKNTKKYFKFNVNGRFKIIKKAKDLAFLPTMYGYDHVVTNWAEVAKKYDGIIFIISEHYKCLSKKLNRQYEFMVESFDVDSVAVFNLDCVQTK